MRKFVATLAVVAAAAGLVATPIEAARLSGEEKLAKLIDGRSAGEPRNCITTTANRSLTVIDGTALVYRQGGRVWVNRTLHPETLDEDDVMVIRRYSSSLCRTDIITTVDRTSGIFTGSIFLGDFVPYEKTS